MEPSYSSIISYNLREIYSTRFKANQEKQEKQEKSYNQQILKSLTNIYQDLTEVTNIRKSLESSSKFNAEPLILEIQDLKKKLEKDIQPNEVQDMEESCRLMNFSQKQQLINQSLAIKYLYQEIRKTSYALVILAPGFEDINAIDILKRANFDVTTVSVGKEAEVPDENNNIFQADKTLDQVYKLLTLFDVVIIPYCSSNVKLARNQKVIRLILKHYNQGKFVASICGDVIAQCDIISGKKVSCHRGSEIFIDSHGGTISKENVCVDGHLITAPKFSNAFANAIVENLN